ncbi:hypothetical protein TEA_007724 [Camellia sinensis var. sinensis]|uniref:PHD-type domain-containing protein n=1 Tax=Camellia sinensis var. sinensis TaxID=542762 RepID=A0A4S4CZW3_CAMSN|nr:hypothetical protein TEA_007724 [Camellia sinensis var. sinensis]
MVVIIEGSPKSEEGDFGVEIFDLGSELFWILAPNRCSRTHHGSQVTVTKRSRNRCSDTYTSIFLCQIFCAKCGSRDSPADNDIILCDGACERGFHQFCLEPPLLKEAIPPGDEGWLCPGCDCKVDCINLLNDFQGTNVSILDTWEKVFPEVAVVNKRFDRVGLGFMSDDSEDNDYDPDASELDEKVEGDESSSDESDFYSASEDFGPSPNNKQNLEHSSDDSEDDDYDPTALDLDEQVKQETSSSDFTSDSEDFSVAFEDELMSALSDHTEPFGGSDGERSKVIRRKKQSLNTELLSLMESSPSQGDSAPVTGKRHVERLDYEKLYDEAYGNDSCDSSDEDWIDAGDIPNKRRKNNTKKVASAFPSGRTPIIEGTNAKDMQHNQEQSEHTPTRRALKNLDVEGTYNAGDIPKKQRKNNTKKVASAFPSGRTPIIEGTNAKDMQHNQEQSEHTPTRRALKKLDVEGTYNSPAKSHKGFSECGSRDSTTKRSCRRPGEAVTQGLIKSFNENHYPDQSMKEKLAMELGVTVHQWEHKLQTSHFPEMVFGDSFLVLEHVNSGIKIQFDTFESFDAPTAWNQEALPPVEFPADAKSKFRRYAWNCLFFLVLLAPYQEWEHKLQTSHFPEMVFGDSFLVLEHVNSGIKIQFDTFESFDAPTAWNQEALPPVEFPADAKSKFRRILGNEASSIRGKDFNGKEELLLALSSLLLVPNLGKIKKDTGIPPKQEALGGQSRSLCAYLWNALQVHNFVRTSSVRAFTVNFWVKLFKRFDIDWCLSIHCGKLNGIGLENVCHYKHFVLMSDGVNMDASSAQENSETRQSSSPRQTTSIQELEFCSKTLFGEATEEHPIGTENVNKGSTKARAAECEYIGIEQFEPLNEDLTLYLSCEQLGQQLEDASIYSNSNQLGLLPEDAAGKNLSTKQTMPELNHELVPGSVNKDIWVEKWKTGTVNFQNVPAEIVTVESYTFGFEQPGQPSEELTRNSSWEQLQPPQEDERKNYLEQLGVPPEDKVVNTSLEQLEMPPDDATNNPSKSGKRTSGKSTKEKHALRSSVGSTRVLRSRLQAKSKAPEASNNMEEKKKQMKKITLDEFSRLRNRLRYLLDRIGYQQTLIDAYSGKDWRGQSVDYKVLKSGCGRRNDGGDAVAVAGCKGRSVTVAHRYDRYGSRYGRHTCESQSHCKSGRNGWRAGLEPNIFASPADGNLTLAVRRTSTNSAKIFYTYLHSAATNFTSTLSLNFFYTLPELKPNRGPPSLVQIDQIRSSLHLSRSVTMYTSRKKIHKVQDAAPTEFEEIVAQTLFDLENSNQGDPRLSLTLGINLSLYLSQSFIHLNPTTHTWIIISSLGQASIPLCWAHGHRCCICFIIIHLLKQSFFTFAAFEHGFQRATANSPADNDIILCDGDCEHGPLQFCLEPPLLKEDVPPGDEGWLCPGCDCKVNCIKLLNDSQGTNFSILDTWETVFPLEASINKDFGLGFSSDDSEENDYDPDPSEVDEKVEGDESSSDDSDFYSASKDFEDSSDDSEDDDYDPTAPDLDEQEAYGNISCDSSDGLDADGIPKKRRKNNTDKVASASPSGRTPIVEGTNAKDMQHSQGESEHTPKKRAHEGLDVEGTNNSPAKFYERGSNGTSTKRFGEAVTQATGNSAKASLMESSPSQGDSAPVTGKRHVERLDYEKLYDEAYGNVSCDSSDGLDADGIPKKRRKNNTDKVASASPSGRTPIVEGTNAKDMQHSQGESEHTPKKRAHEGLDVEGTNNSPAKFYERGSNGTSTKRFGEAVTQGRYFLKAKDTDHHLVTMLASFSKRVDDVMVVVQGNWEFGESKDRLDPVPKQKGEPCGRTDPFLFRLRIFHSLRPTTLCLSKSKPHLNSSVVQTFKSKGGVHVLLRYNPTYSTFSAADHIPIPRGEQHLTTLIFPNFKSLRDIGVEGSDSVPSGEVGNQVTKQLS